MTREATTGRGRPSARNRRRGVALLIVVAYLAIMTALCAEFSYGTRVDLSQAANARDELRAHYMARSSVALSRLLIKIQQKFIDPIMAQAQQLLAQAGVPGGLGLSLRVTDYAGPLMQAFSGSEEEVGALAGLVGIDITGAKGLGLKSGHFDAAITPEDGKIDINCGGGLTGDLTAGKNRQIVVYRLLMAMMFSPAYNDLFSTPDPQGQIVDRDSTARAVIDWADADEQMFSPEGNSAAEDYRYDARGDPYKAHDNQYDSVEEIALVRGVREDWLAAFSPFLTVYAADPLQGCRVNLNALGRDCAPLMMGILRAAAVPDPTRPPADPSVLDDRRLYPLATIACQRAATGGFDKVDSIVALLQNPLASISPEDPRYPLLQSMAGLTINRADLDKVAYTGAPRVYRVVGSGESGHVKKKITAIIDTARVVENPLTINPAAEKDAGVLQYWREE